MDLSGTHDDLDRVVGGGRVGGAHSAGRVHDVVAVDLVPADDEQHAAGAEAGPGLGAGLVGAGQTSSSGCQWARMAAMLRVPMVSLWPLMAKLAMRCHSWCGG